MNSMTGFGRSEGTIENQQVTVEVKSLNHRYLDIRFRMPSFLNLLEVALSEVIRQRFERGSFEVSVRNRLLPSEKVSVSATRFVIDETAVQTYLDAYRVLAKKLSSTEKPKAETMSLNERIVVPIEQAQDAQTWLEPMKKLVGNALSQLVQMRQIEGLKIREILSGGVSELSQIVVDMDRWAGQQPKRVEERLRTRLAQWSLPSSVDPQRLEWEIALLAERSAINEELDRLRHHCKQFNILLDGDKNAGRKLDFLTQELNREVNTVGSKAALLEITQLTVQAKTVIEKLREQIQNVE
ncbi:MAG: YicC family protein [Deltaproteobacteria bacterium]|nr:YicC family protein [Deltaproteobacteria bacterium]